MDCIWEVGKTYRTMVPEITATASTICEAGGYVVAKINSPMGRYDGGELFFNDGELHAFRISDGGVLGFNIAEFPKMPHLTSAVVPDAIINCPWKVGRTYKTTVPGVVATVDWICGHGMSIRGRINGEAAEWNWHLDGKLFGFRNHKEMHHLLTEEADPPVNAKASRERGSEYDTQEKLLERIAQLEKELAAMKEVRKVVNGDGTETWSGLKVVVPSNFIQDGEMPVEVRSLAVGIRGKTWIQCNGSRNSSDFMSLRLPGELRIIVTYAPRPEPVTWDTPASLPDGEYEVSSTHMTHRGECWWSQELRFVRRMFGADWKDPPRIGRYCKSGQVATWIGE